MYGEAFPIDLAQLKPMTLDPSDPKVSDDDKAKLERNIRFCRGAIAVSRS